MVNYECIIAGRDGRKKRVIRSFQSVDDLFGSYAGSQQYLIGYKEIGEKEMPAVKRLFSRNTVLSFTEIIHSLLASGLSLQHSLKVYQSISSGKEEMDLARILVQAVDQGQSLYTGLKPYVSSFSPLYVSMVHIGEKTGSLLASFGRMVGFLRMSSVFRTRLANALLYPVFVLAVAICGCIGIAVYIVPRLSTVLSGFDVQGQAAVNAKISAGFSMAYYSLAFISILAIASFVLMYFRKRNERLAAVLDRFVLRVPYVGKLISYNETFNFAFSMELLVSNGFPVSVALSESAHCVSNVAYRNALSLSSSSLLKGVKLSSALVQSPVIPPYIGTWVSVAEETGDIEGAFTQIKNYFQSNYETMINRIMALIEPAFILVTGVIIFVLIMQFVLPIFSLYGQVL